MIGTIQEIIDEYLNDTYKSHLVIRTSNGSLMTDGKYLFSHNVVICYKRGKTLYINNQPYSSSTSHHRNCLINSNTSYKIRYYNGNKITIFKLIQEIAKLEKLQCIL